MQLSGSDFLRSRAVVGGAAYKAAFEPHQVSCTKSVAFTAQGDLASDGAEGPHMYAHLAV
jgi:hypothetical protein